MNESKRIGLAVAVAVLASLAADQALAQEARTGVSKPEPMMTTTAPDIGVPPAAPAAVPAKVEYLPYTQTGGDPNAVATRRPLADAASKPDPDAGIVTYVPSAPGELPDGTVLKARLREDLSTLTTRPGTAFTAEVTEPVLRDGRVIVPAGAIVSGRVTSVHSGKRIGGLASIHLEPKSVTLPDGSEYALHARAIDTDRWNDTKVDSEGTILRRENTKRNIAVMSLTTGAGMATGAMIGGLPGALIGAGVGAGVSTVVWLKQDRQADLPKDLGIVFSLTAPMAMTPANAGVRVTPSPGGE
jgi:hypothetical protein